MWRAKMSQAELARAIGTNANTMGRMLRGERAWALAALVAVARELDTTVAYLIGETDNPERKKTASGNPEAVYMLLPHLDSNQEPSGLTPDIPRDYAAEFGDIVSANFTSSELAATIDFQTTF